MAASYVPDVCYKDQVNELLERLSIQFLEMVPIRKMKWKVKYFVSFFTYLFTNIFDGKHCRFLSYYTSTSN